MPNETLHVNDDETTIQRCAHDEENPYALISRALIRDASISPECRWLIMYFLSMQDGWKINMKQLIIHLKPHMGRDKVYAVMNEAIEAGYIKREEIKSSKGKNKLSTQTKYFVSEKPKFKKSFRHPDFQDTEIQDPENTDIKEITYIKNKHIKDKTSLKVPKEPVAAKAAQEKIALPLKVKKEKSDFSPKVREVANKLLQIVVDDSPSYIIPKNLTPFLQEVQNMLNLDKRDPEVLYAVLRASLPDPYYGPGLLNGNLAKKLRDKFVTLEKKMNAKPKENSNQVDRRLRDKDGQVVDAWKDDLF